MLRRRVYTVRDLVENVQRRLDDEGWQSPLILGQVEEVVHAIEPVQTSARQRAASRRA
jgi:hypothetical protein